MSGISDVARWCYKNPGVWSPGQLAEAMGGGISRQTAGKALSDLVKVEPGIFSMLGRGTYLVKPPEFREHEQEKPTGQVIPAWPPGNGNGNGNGRGVPPQSTFEEILPDDEDLYPPVTIQFYDHFRDKRGSQWFRVKDERGQRGIFRYIEDD